MKLKHYKILSKAGILCPLLGKTFVLPKSAWIQAESTESVSEKFAADSGGTRIFPPDLRRLRPTNFTYSNYDRVRLSSPKYYAWVRLIRRYFPYSDSFTVHLSTISADPLRLLFFRIRSHFSGGSARTSLADPPENYRDKSWHAVLPMMMIWF